MNNTLLKSNHIRDVIVLAGRYWPYREDCSGNSQRGGALVDPEVLVVGYIQTSWTITVIILELRSS